MQSQEFKNLARELKSNLSRLMEQRSTWESHWQECADFMQPRKAEITNERARGDKRNLQIFDATAIHALELLASSLQRMLTSSANRWFSLRYKEDQLNGIDEAKEWLEDVTDKMYLAFAGSNFTLKTSATLLKKLQPEQPANFISTSRKSSKKWVIGIARNSDRQLQCASTACCPCRGFRRLHPVVLCNLLQPLRPHIGVL